MAKEHALIVTGAGASHLLGANQGTVPLMGQWAADIVARLVLLRLPNREHTVYMLSEMSPRVDPRWKGGSMPPSSTQRAEARRIAKAISEVGFCLPGTLL